MNPVYLDYAATTPVDPRVASALAGCLTLGGDFGNPGSLTHVYGLAARERTEQARTQVAQLVGADRREIVWTSGATEANNLAIKGAAGQYQRRGKHIVTCKTEHKAVLDVCRQLEHQGFSVTYLDPEQDGTVSLQCLQAALREDTILVSLMHVNNETGVIAPLQQIAALTRPRGILLHVDAAQSAGKLPLDLAGEHAGIDLLSLCAHKLYGPKGVGALYVRRRPKVRLQAVLHGGGQEQGLRAGTLPVHQLVAMGEACAIAAAERGAEYDRIQHLRHHLLTGLAPLSQVHLNGSTDGLPHILNVSFAGIAGEALLQALRADVAVSSGSACTSAAAEASHVLTAMGCDAQHADAALRFSIGRFTQVDDIDRAVAAVNTAVQRLREISPLWNTSPRA